MIEIVKSGGSSITSAMNNQSGPQYAASTQVAYSTRHKDAALVVFCTLLDRIDSNLHTYDELADKAIEASAALIRKMP